MCAWMEVLVELVSTGGAGEGSKLILPTASERTAGCSWLSSAAHQTCETADGESASADGSGSGSVTFPLILT